MKLVNVLRLTDFPDKPYLLLKPKKSLRPLDMSAFQDDLPGEKRMLEMISLRC